MSNNQNKLGIFPIPKLILSVSVPLMVSMLVQSMYNIVDSMFVSRISEDALTATSIAYPAQMIMLSVAVGTGVGINSLISRRLGEKNVDLANKTATTGLVLAGSCSIIFILFGLFGTKLFLSFFTDNSDVLELSNQYLQICQIGCMGIFFATTGERLLQATGNTILSMIAQLSGAIVNIIFDPILIFGLLGFPEMGIRGAAIATIAGQISAAICSLALNHIKNKEIKFVFKGFKLDVAIIADIYKVGIPTMVMQTMSSFMMIGMNIILKSYDSAVAAFGIYYKLYTFMYMPISGLSQGLIPIMGYNYGAKNGKRMKEAFKFTVITAVAVFSFGALLFIALPEKLLMLYEVSDTLTSIGVGILRTFAFTFPIVGITVTIGFACSALGNGLVSMIATLIRQLLVLVPISAFLCEYFGLRYAWYGSWLSEIIAVIFAVFCFKKEYKSKIKPYI